jgi:hypothetical protein
MRPVCLCLCACLQDVANVFYALGSLGLETLEPLLGAQPLQDLLHQLLGKLQRLTGSAEPQVRAAVEWVTPGTACSVPAAQPV